MKKFVIPFLLALLIIFQYQLWFSPSGLAKTISLKHAVAQQQAKNTEAVERNAKLRADITALKQGTTAIEDHARSDLGLIKKGEMFYQLVN